ncbi:hypothetical protein EHRUM3_02460, partial [Ehrlichia ruminantium]
RKKCEVIVIDIIYYLLKNLFIILIFYIDLLFFLLIL